VLTRIVAGGAPTVANNVFTSSLVYSW